MASFFSKLIPNRSVNRFETIVEVINGFEPKFQSLSLEELKARSLELREKVQNADGSPEILDDILPEAFALARESSVRTLKQRHFDVQLIGGATMHEGKIAEMLTGEGKTLAATAPTYLNALTGRGVHVVTVNDYLAKRDATWMGQIYHALGLSVSCIVHDTAYQYDPMFEASETDETTRDILGGFKVVEKFLRPISRKEAYDADITYGTNHEFGFDFLRDNLTANLEFRVQRQYNYAIIDEIDSILIDEARTPLIVAAPDQASSEYYKTFTRVVEKLVPETDYIVDEKLRIVNLTDEGINKVEKMINVGNIFDPENSRLVHYLDECLKAKALFNIDKEYVVRNGEVLIVDQFTGRILMGRRYSGGLHQAIEAKEGVFVKEENRTYAQVTIQNYFRLYKKIAGMTGTAETSAEEFHKVYNLDVISIPPNRPMVRKDLSDAIYKTKEEKYKAIAQKAKELHEKGQPVLIGTASIANNEVVSNYLNKAGVPHEVLNAKNHEREGAIIAQAGRRGSVTVATNMAGRGVDIVLGGNPSTKEEADEILSLGGLFVIGTERHEARRIDNQLRGRSGRQGDPGMTQFFLSLEDELVRIFGGDRIKSIMETVKFPEGTPIESSFVTKAVNQAQQKIEGANFDTRKHLLDFDDVLNKQRGAFYFRRTKLLIAGKEGTSLPIIKESLEHYVQSAEKAYTNAKEQGSANIEEMNKKVEEMKTILQKIPATIEPERSAILAGHAVRILDTLWIDHLEQLEGLRESVNIRAYAQHEPLVEYRRDAHRLFQQMEAHYEALLFTTTFPIFDVDLKSLQAHRERVQQVPPPPQAKDIGRNDPCWCGSGKKYKKCHGK